MSPDGTQAVVEIDSDQQGSHIWIVDLERGIHTRLSLEGSSNRNPVWTPDGGSVVFGSDRAGSIDLYLKAADGSGAAERLATSEHNHLPLSWSPEGPVLLFQEDHPETNADIHMRSAEDGTTTAFIVTPANERGAAFSPDGHWVRMCRTSRVKRRSSWCRSRIGAAAGKSRREMPVETIRGGRVLGTSCSTSADQGR